MPGWVKKSVNQWKEIIELMETISINYEMIVGIVVRKLRTRYTHRYGDKASYLGSPLESSLWEFPSPNFQMQGHAIIQPAGTPRYLHQTMRQEQPTRQEWRHGTAVPSSRDPKVITWSCFGCFPVKTLHWRKMHDRTPWSSFPPLRKWPSVGSFETVEGSYLREMRGRGERPTYAKKEAKLPFFLLQKIWPPPTLANNKWVRGTSPLELVVIRAKGIPSFKD